MSGPAFCGIDPFLDGNAHPLAFWQCPVEAELSRAIAAGKKLVPGMDAVRLWLSYGAWQRNPDAFMARFEGAVALCARENVRVAPCLFNRAMGGAAGPRGELFLDHLLPGTGWAYRRGFFEPYFRTLFTRYRGDERILFWDICNQPYPYAAPGGAHAEWFAVESELMREMLWAARGFLPAAPVTLALTAGPGLPAQPVAAAGDFPLLVYPEGAHPTEVESPAVLPAGALRVLRPKAGYFVYGKTVSVMEETTA